MYLIFNYINFISIKIKIMEMNNHLGIFLINFIIPNVFILLIIILFIFYILDVFMIRIIFFIFLVVYIFLFILFLLLTFIILIIVIQFLCIIVNFLPLTKLITIPHINCYQLLVIIIRLDSLYYIYLY